MLTYSGVEMIVFPGRYMVLAMVALLAVPAVGTVTALESEAIPAAFGITVIIDFGNGTVINTYNLTGSTVLEVTESSHSVDVEWYGPYALVTAIDDISSSGSGHWQYWVNGVYAASACNIYQLSDTDEVRWVRTSPQYTGEPANLGNDRLLAVGFVGGFGAIVLILLYIIVRRKT
jgi:hypothetical protein